MEDFGHHLFVVHHGLRDDRIDTSEVDCLLTHRYLVAVYEAQSPTVDALWSHFLDTAGSAPASPDEALGILADLLTRRLRSVGEAFNVRVEDLIGQALEAEPPSLREMMAVRLDLAAVRRVVHPQRETLGVLQTSLSPLVTTMPLHSISARRSGKADGDASP